MPLHDVETERRVGPCARILGPLHEFRLRFTDRATDAGVTREAWMANHEDVCLFLDRLNGAEGARVRHEARHDLSQALERYLVSAWVRL